jgi:hypothetical protein
VPEIGLDAASVVAVVGELEPACVPQHVGMNGKGEFRGHARPGHHALISGCGKRCATFRHEDVGRRWRFAQELAQRPTFPGRYRMHAGIPAFGPAYVQAQTCNRLSKDLGSTVLFCDLVDSTGIASKLDATDLDA